MVNVKITPTEYKITFDDGEVFFLLEATQYNGDVLWKIVDDFNYCLDNELNWVREPTPSNRRDEYLKSSRFKYDDAIQKIIFFKEKEKIKLKNMSH